jgi:CHAT domain-containing protein
VLGSKGQVKDADWLTNQVLDDVQRHVESCPDCNLRVQMHRSAQNELFRIRDRADVSSGPDCVAESAWLQLAAGVLPETRARDLLKHASQCGHCGPLLKDAMNTLSDDVTPQEEQMLASLKSTKSDWQRGMAQTLQGGTRQKKPLRETLTWPWFSWSRGAVAIAAVCVVIMAVWLGTRAFHPSSPGELLAEAYAQRRPFDARIPDSKYGPLREERGAGASNFEKPPSLLKAESMIAEGIEKHPNDPDWLAARARADLLDGNYDSSITTLRKALEDRPESPELLRDLGTAYLLRGETTTQEIQDNAQGVPSEGASDYSEAVEFLGRALAKSPDDVIALFNHALACERLFLYSRAVHDWEHYLRLDSQGDWSDEARNRLAEVKQKLEQRQKSLAEPPLTPEAIAHFPQNNNLLWSAIDDRSDEYLRLAITNWLPDAFAATQSHQSNDARIALDVLGRITQERHADSWLAELLSQIGGATFPLAVRTLAASLIANQSGDYTEGLKSAQSAVLLFRKAANHAGELRALAEEVYSEHLLWEGKPCIQLLDSLEPNLRNSSYTWLRAQMGLERSNCANLVGDLGTYQSSIDRGTNDAQIHNYKSLYLRGLGFQSLAAASQGETRRSFNLAARGLGIFWSSQVDLMKGYNLYTDLDAAADDQHLPHLQVAIWQEATALIDQHPNVLLRAMAHRWYGNAAYLANFPKLAASEFSEASALLASLPQNKATTRDRLDAEVWLARMEARQGDTQQASMRLKSISSMLEDAPSFDPEIGFYTTQADIAMQANDPATTESALRSAIFLSEWALNSFPSEADRHDWADQSRSAYRDLVEWRFRQGDTSTALELWEWYRGAELRASEHTGPSIESTAISAPPDAKEAPALPSPTIVANRLPFLRDQTVLVYGTFPDGVAVWSYDDRGITSHWIAIPLPQLQELTIRFERLCADPTSDLMDLRTTGRSLYDLLIAPVKSRLTPGRTVLFESDDALENVPFEALVDGGGRYLIEQFAIVMSPGLYRAMRLRSEVGINSNSSTLIVSVPNVENSDFPPLEDAENEAQGAADKFSSVRWLQNQNATLSAIRQDIRGMSVFHFAGHAVSSHSRNGLVLAEVDPYTKYPRLISAASFTTRQILDLQLAVLSACQTGSEDTLALSGSEDLATGFLTLGVPHVIASRWKVDSAQTAELMKQFYARLVSGSSVSDALRGAQLTLASKPASSHPYYWAAFGVHGTS